MPSSKYILRSDVLNLVHRAKREATEEAYNEARFHHPVAAMCALAKEEAAKFLEEQIEMMGWRAPKPRGKLARDKRAWRRK